jgi:hypothetical protein
VQRALDIIIREGLTGLFAARKAGATVPVALVASLLGLLLLLLLLLLPTQPVRDD